MFSNQIQTLAGMGLELDLQGYGEVCCVGHHSPQNSDLGCVLFFFGYALWEFRQYSRLDDTGALLRGIGALMGAVGFGVYLRSFVRSLRN